MEEFYIVWSNKKRGYFSKWTPISGNNTIGNDLYLDNYLNAKRYKSLKFALNKCRFIEKISQVQELIKKFDNNKSIIRQKKLHRLNGEKFIPNYDDIKIFDDFRIDIIEINGNDIKLKGEIKKEFFYNYLLEIEKKLIKKLPKIIKTDLKNVDEADINDSFWD